ncbi:MAG: PH domain-containing protein [Brachybacterium sp.]
MPVVRYRALKTGWVRGALGCVMALPILTMFVGGAVLLTLDSLAGMLGAVMCWAVGVLLVVMLVIGTRVQFIVDDDGLTLVHYLRTHRIPWEQIAVIEQSNTYWTTGAVVVVLKHPPGRRITALATTDRLALYRGENPFRFIDSLAQLRWPAQAAIAAHRRWLAASSR